jgi:uncharacterized RDD family membrane protein YckC
MNCPQCGEVCSCPSDYREPGLPESHPDKILEAALPPFPPADARAGTLESAPPDSVSKDEEQADAAWREELAARLNRYRSRRKIRPPRYPSPQLPFDGLERSRNVDPVPRHANFEPLSASALALNDAAPSHPPREALPAESALQPAPNLPLAPPAEKIGPQNAASAKIIEFPRFAWAPPSPPPDQLAEPVLDRPRILEVPETAPPPPALGGITIEPAESPKVEKQPGVDFPLQSASLSRRIFAFLIDGLIIAAASALFGFVFLKVARVRPPMPQVLLLAATVPVLLCAIYDYLLIVYGSRTPGLLAAGLELARFDGNSTSRSIRRWRVLASYLSAVSLGMGYAWVFLDEDALCWHDRITRTYLAPRRKALAKSTP